MIFGINCGHCIEGADTGAEGNGLKEQNLTRLIGKIVMYKLQTRGHKVIDCTVNQATSVDNALNQICIKANAQPLDYFISIHLNASDTRGHGCECFTYNKLNMTPAIDILKNLQLVGFTNRGIKDGKNLYVIRNTKASAILIEVCFIDNPGDMGLFNVEKVATAIVNGLIGVPVAPKVNLVLETQKFLNKVIDAKLVEDGIMGPKTRQAYADLGGKL